MKVLVLGGDGFLGSHLVDQTVRSGHEVSVFDRFPYLTSRNLEHQKSNIHLISGEFSNREDLKRALLGQDVVYHFIWIANPAASWSDPLVEIEENLKNSIHLFRLAAECGVKKVVFPSSGGTIYTNHTEKIKEDTLPNPFSPYGITKISAEFFLQYVHKQTGLGYDIYRIGNAYGPRQPLVNSQGVLAVWMNAVLNDTELQVYGDQNTLRDYIYVEDIAYLMTHSLNDLTRSNIYNLGTGSGTSIAELFDIFQKAVGKSLNAKKHPRRIFDNSSIVLDSSRLLSFFPNFKFNRLEDKVLETWNYVRSEYDRKTTNSLA